MDRATTDVEYQMMDEEYVYLTKDLGWKEGLREKIEEEELKCDPKDVTKFSEYLFITIQMGWKNGPKVLGEKGEEAIENELQASAHQRRESQSFKISHVSERKEGWKKERQRMR